jgi:hypothetical protein
MSSKNGDIILHSEVENDILEVPYENNATAKKNSGKELVFSEKRIPASAAERGDLT